MISDFLSVVLIGDSHVAGYPPEFSATVKGTARPLKTLLRTAHIFGGYSAVDMTVTFQDGRVGLNPLLEGSLRFFPGLNIKSKPVTPGETAQKHVVLSIGTSLSALDPGMDVGDREGGRFFFGSGVDFALPARPDLALDITSAIIPVALIREMYTNLLAPVKIGLSILSDRFPGRLSLVGSPPPSDDNVVKRGLVSKYTNVPQDQVVLPSPETFLKLWLLVNEIVADICRETGVKFIRCAPSTCDARGFLKKEYVHDGFHANADYNGVMLGRIISALVAREMGLASKTAEHNGEK